jgi:SAM-dependent methyltransferase
VKDGNHANPSPIRTSLQTLHLGCGNKKEAGAFGIDFNPYPGVDLVYDLNETPFPLESNQFSRILAVDVLEHLDNFVGAIDEIYRVARDEAEVVITGPFATSMDRHHDPTHRRGFTRLTFDYFIVGREHYKRYAYSKTTRFKLIRFGYCLNGPPTLLRRALMKVANRFPRFYERYLPYLIPMDYMYFILSPLKGPIPKE